MSKIKKKRVGFVLDMTPLVDITFLLLTFFMFTAKFKSESGSDEKFVIKRPQTVADTAKLPEKDLITIKVAVDTVSRDTAYYLSMLNEQDKEALSRKMIELEYPGVQANQKQFKISDTTWLEKVIREVRGINSQAQVAIDADKGIRYRYIETLMDKLRRNRATSFYFITDKKQ